MPGLGGRAAHLRAVELPDAEPGADGRRREQQDEDHEHPGTQRGAEHRRRRTAFGLRPRGPDGRRRAGGVGVERVRGARGAARASGARDGVDEARARSRLTVPRGSSASRGPDRRDAPDLPSDARGCGEHHVFHERSPSPCAPGAHLGLYGRDEVHIGSKDPRSASPSDDEAGTGADQAPSDDGERAHMSTTTTEPTTWRRGSRPAGRQHDAGTDRQVVASRQLPVGRADLPARQRAAARAAHAGPRQATPARPLGHDARPELPVRAPEPRDRGAQPVDDLHHRPGARRPGARRERVPRRHVLRGLLRHHRRRRGHAAPVPAVLVPRRHPEPRRARDAGVDPRGRRARLRPEPRVRRRVRQPGPARRDDRRRRRGRDRPAGHELALEQVRERREGRRRPADPAPQRVQDREPDGPRAHQRRGAQLADGRVRAQAARVRRGLRRRVAREHPRPVRHAARRGPRRDRRHQGQRRASSARCGR